ncbi:MAG: acetate/propionate family kinase, partial [Steroidobacteraceae bacterium]
MQPSILAVNGGSSSIRLALYESASQRLLLSGLIACDGTSPASIGVAAEQLISWLESKRTGSTIVAAGHRIVQGMTHTAPARITPQLLDGLRRVAPFDAEHMPLELALIDSIQRHYPQLPQFACFDTAFHRDLPQVARLLPIPRRYAAQGVRRYGFHGLSYSY